MLEKQRKLLGRKAIAVVIFVVALAMVFLVLASKTAQQEKPTNALAAGIAVASEPAAALVLADSLGKTMFEKIAGDKVLRACYIVYPPAVIKDPKTGALSGHFVDAVEHVAVETGWRAEYQETTWSNWVAGLQSKRCDVSIAPTFATISRAAAVSFSKPFFYVGNSAVVRKGDSRFKRIEDFNKPGVKIAVAEGEASHAFAQKYLTEAELVVLSTASGGDLTLPMVEVSSGRVDAALSDAFVCAKYAAEHSEVTDLLADDPYGLTGVGWAVRTNDVDLLNFLNTAVDAMDDSGLLVQWEAKYDAHWLHKKPVWVKS